ncbi:DNA-binding protein [Thozetella sp. PMI_491]|nr:DNA-binding protein [Thozetella sp. PMI_491]
MEFTASDPGTESSQPPSLGITEAHNLLTSFNTFLTISIHNILYYRSIYPQATFLSAKAYNLPVHQNRHPKVCAWIQDAVDAVGAQLAQGDVHRVAVVIHAAQEVPTAKPTEKPSEKAKETPSTTSGSSSGNKSKTPSSGAVLERWMFDVSSFPAWPGGSDAMGDFGSALQAQSEDNDGGEGDLEEDPAAADDGDDGDNDSDVDDAEVNWVDVDEQFRGAISRMAHTAEKMGHLPPRCTFTVAVELKQEGKTPIGHPQPWIPSPANLQTPSKGKRKKGKDVGGRKSIPIRSVAAGPLFFECWVEEAQAKLDASEAAQGDAVKAP